MDNIKSKLFNKPMPIEVNSQIEAPISKRLLAFIIDLGLSIILGLLLCSVAFEPLLGFSSQQDVTSEKLDTVEDIGVSTHLYLKVNDTLLSNAELTDNYLSHEFGLIIGENESEYLDPLAYFYVNYLHNDFTYFNQTILKLPSSISANNSNSYYVYDETKTNPLSEAPKLNEESFLELSLYFNDEINSTNQAIYDDFSSYYINLLSEAQSTLVGDTSGEYYLAIQDYYAEYHSLMWISTDSALISYAISLIIFFIIIPVISKNGKTLGKRMFKLHILSQDNKEISKWNILSRGIAMLPSLFMGIGFVPFISWTIYGFFLPFIELSESFITMLIPILISLAIALISFLIVITNKHHQSPHDTIAQSIVVVDWELEMSPLEDENLLSIDTDILKR
jgi:uncharacterized RDD family membrane protein YckC